MKTEVRSFRFLSVAIVLLMLATLICCFTVMTSAAGTQLSIDREDLDLSGLQTDGSQLYFKNYDGTTSANVRLKANADIGIAAGDDVTVVVSAAFNSKNVADAKYIEVSFDLDGADAGKYTEPASLRIDATIRPAVLQWAENGKATTNYKPGATTYEDIEVQIPALDTTKIVSGEQVSASTTPVKVTLGGVNGVGEYVASTKVDLTGADAVNYVAAQLSVDVTVEKLEIVDVRWNSEYVFDWGEKEAYEIEVFGFDAEDVNPKLRNSLHGFAVVGAVDEHIGLITCKGFHIHKLLALLALGDGGVGVDSDGGIFPDGIQLKLHMFRAVRHRT